MCLVSSRRVAVGINLRGFSIDKTPWGKESMWLLVSSRWHIPHPSETESSLHGPFRTIYFCFYSWPHLPSAGSKLAKRMDFCTCKNLPGLGKNSFPVCLSWHFSLSGEGVVFSRVAICLLIFALILSQWGSFSFLIHIRKKCQLYTDSSIGSDIGKWACVFPFGVP